MLLPTPHPILAAALLILCPLALGCGSPEPPADQAAADADQASADADPASDAEHGAGGQPQGEHEHGASGDHAGHDHPPHGAHGGHLVSLTPGDAHVEWDHRTDSDQVIIYTTELGNTVTGVQMRYQIQGQEPKTFELERAEEIAEHAYQISSPELLTAIQAGEAADVTLIVTADGQELTAPIEHHEH